MNNAPQNAQATLETQIASEVETISNVSLGCSFEYLQPALEDFVYGSVCSQSIRAVYFAYVTIAAVGFLALIIIFPIVNRRWRIVKQAMLTVDDHNTCSAKNDGKPIWQNEVRLARARHIMLEIFKRLKGMHDKAEDEEFDVSDDAVRGHKSQTNDSEVSCWSNVSYVDIEVDFTPQDEDDGNEGGNIVFEEDPSHSEFRRTSRSNSKGWFITTPMDV